MERPFTRGIELSIAQAVVSSAPIQEDGRGDLRPAVARASVNEMLGGAEWVPAWAVSPLWVTGAEACDIGAVKA